MESVPVLIFLCDQSYASHGRDFLLGVTILNSSASYVAQISNLGEHERTTTRKTTSKPFHQGRKATGG